MWHYHVFSTIRNDKYMPTVGVHRIHDKICEKKRIYQVYLAYLCTVNDGERTFAGGQLRNGRFALKTSTCSRRDRAARRRDTWTRNAFRRSYRPQSVRASGKPFPIIIRS